MGVIVVRTWSRVSQLLAYGVQTVLECREQNVLPDLLRIAFKYSLNVTVNEHFYEAFGTLRTTHSKTLNFVTLKFSFELSTNVTTNNDIGTWFLNSLMISFERLTNATYYLEILKFVELSHLNIVRTSLRRRCSVSHSKPSFWITN
jgi:hypothetical protein